MVFQTIIHFSNFGRSTRNITDSIAEVVTISGVQCGSAQVFVQHTSCSLLVTENLHSDVRHNLETIMRRLAPDTDPAYRHLAEKAEYMAAQVRTMLTATEITIPVGSGQLLLGTRQGVFLWEHRVAERRRSVVITVHGTD